MKGLGARFETCSPEEFRLHFLSAEMIRIGRSLETLAIASRYERIARAERKSCAGVETWPGDGEGHDKCRRSASPFRRNNKHVREGG
jgi:hypothetical protein